MKPFKGITKPKRYGEGMLSQDPSTGKFTFTSPTPSTRGSTRASTRSYNTRPFALDTDDGTEITDFSRSSIASRGYRDGGPKEARLKRVAFLSKAKEIDHLFPVKVENIGQSIDEESLGSTFSEYGEVGDVYIPKDSRNRPISNFAVVRYKSPEGRERALSNSPTMSQTSLSRERLSVSPVRPQRSYFSKGTGYHGICNIPVEDGTYDRRPVTVQQDISLESCRSRSGYPWGSVRELKFLPPHPSKDATFSYSIRIDDLPRHIKEAEIKQFFEQYGKVVDVSCPKPLVVTQQTKDPNCGYAFVRFSDPRDRHLAIRDLGAGKVVFDGQVLRGKEILPSFWPTEQTRRYY